MDPVLCLFRQVHTGLCGKSPFGYGITFCIGIYDWFGHINVLSAVCGLSIAIVLRIVPGLDIIGVLRNVFGLRIICCLSISVSLCINLIMIIGCNCYGFCSRTDIFFRIGGRLLRQIVRYFRGFCLFFAFAGN